MSFIIRMQLLLLLNFPALLMHGQQGYSQDPVNKFGPLEIHCTSDSIIKHTTCNMLLNNNIVSTSYMNEAQPNSSFYISSGQFLSKGTFSLSCRDDLGLCTINTDMWYKSGTDSIYYSGAISSWKTNASIQPDTSGTIYYQLAPTLSAQSKISGTGKTVASVSLYYGPQQVYSVTVTLASPQATTTEDIVLGDLLIKKGMIIKLRIPSAIQPGLVTMNVQYATTDHPLTSFNAVIASWSF